MGYGHIWEADRHPLTWAGEGNALLPCLETFRGLPAALGPAGVCHPARRAAEPSDFRVPRPVRPSRAP